MEQFKDFTRKYYRLPECCCWNGKAIREKAAYKREQTKYFNSFVNGIAPCGGSKLIASTMAPSEAL